MQIHYSLSISLLHANLGSAVITFSYHSFFVCLIISGTLRLVSLIKLSEEAGIQYFGPDNVAIKQIRMIVITTSGLLSLVFIQDPGLFKLRFYPSAEYTYVSYNPSAKLEFDLSIF